jgi:putative NIF3 family GTP cyclohydrolase 1 type 2
MRFKEIYDLAINLGIDSDIRDLSHIKTDCSEYYSDSQILHGDHDLEVENIILTIDIGIDLILLINEMRKNNIKIDAVIAHHPTFFASYRMPEVAKIQEANWIRYGVDQKTSAFMIDRLIREETISIGSGNHLKAVFAAKSMDIPLMCLHTAIDNITQNFFERLINEHQKSTIGDLLKVIKKIKECAMGAANGNGPYLVDEKTSERLVGNCMVDMTGALDPPQEIFKLLKECKVDTIVGMHYGMENIRSIIEADISSILIGHMAGDSIGLNHFCDILEDNGVNIIGGPGFYRFKRK